MRLAIIATHPIQYHAPWFRALAREPGLELRVHFGLIPDARTQGIGFGVPFQWDIPLLEGYDWVLLPNSARRPSLAGPFGIRTPSIGAALASFRPDAVLLLGWGKWMLLQALFHARRLGFRTLVRGESNAMRKRPWPVRQIHRALFRRYDGFLAIGRSNAELYRRAGVPDERVFPCRYFVENERFRTQAGELRPGREALRRSFGVPPGSVCFLFAGKLQEKKRVGDILAALARAGRSDLHLLVVGDGHLRRELESFASQHRLSVSFAGFLNQSEIARAYVAADCLVLPSDAGETWGLVVNEAMACGLPAIVSDQVGCGPDLVEDGVTGRVFPLGEVEALAAALVSMAEPDRRMRLARAASERIQAYTVDAAVGGVLTALRTLASGAGC